MTPREHYEKIATILEKDDNVKLMSSILECKEIRKVKENCKKFYTELNALIIENIDTYYKNKKEYLNEYVEIMKEIELSNSLDDIKSFATYMYDTYVIEKIRDYAYNERLYGGNSDYIKLASDMQDVYMADLKEQGYYEEWK